MSGKLKMDEIAALTGYSVSTVSRVLSGKSYTSDKAREAIVSCARGLGVLDSLSSGRLLINGIAVFAPLRTFTARGDAFYLEVTRGIAEAIAPHDVYLSYCGLDEQRADIKVFQEKANNKNINAIILIGIDDPTVHKLAQLLDKPCVLINSQDKEGYWMRYPLIIGRLATVLCNIFLIRGTGVFSMSPACAGKRCIGVWRASRRSTDSIKYRLMPGAICW